MGWAVMEDFVMKDGVPQTKSLETYLIPTIDDAPDIDTLLVESGDPTGPFGAKGIAEVVIVPPGPSIGNAIRDAVGITVDRFPATPERLYGFLRNASAKAAS